MRCRYLVLLPILISLLTACSDNIPEARSTVGIVTNLTREPPSPTRPKSIIQPCTRPAKEPVSVVYADTYLDDWTGWICVETDPWVADTLHIGDTCAVYWSRTKTFGALWRFEAVGKAAPDDYWPRSIERPTTRPWKD